MTAPILNGSLPLYCTISATTWPPTINHGQFAASIIKPYVSRPVTWTVNMHGLFQQTYYAILLDKTPAAAIAITIIPILNIALTFAPNGTNRLLIRTIKHPRSSTLSLWWRRFLLVRLLITVSCSATATTRLWAETLQSACFKVRHSTSMESSIAAINADWSVTPMLNDKVRWSRPVNC